MEEFKSSPGHAELNSNNKNLGYCGYHLCYHDASECSHELKLMNPTEIPVNRESALKIIEKITEVCSGAKIERQKIINFKYNSIKNIETKSDLILSKLNGFIEACKTVIAQINSIRTLPIKKIYSPLESILQLKDVSRVLENITVPQAKFPIIDPEIHYEASRFPHTFYNSSEISIGYPRNSREKIEIYPIKKAFKDNQFGKLSRSLVIDRENFLVTGGLENNKPSSLSFFVSCNGKNLEKVFCEMMNSPRNKHAMTWIQNKPAVLGGFDGENSIADVEVLSEGAWKKHSVLNIPRNSLSAITTSQFVFVVGGGANKSPINSIEKYEENQWKVLNVLIGPACFNIGLCYVENSLLLIGGIEGTLPTDLICRFDIAEGTNSIIGKLEKNMCFTQNQFAFSKFIEGTGLTNGDSLTVVKVPLDHSLI